MIRTVISFASMLALTIIQSATAAEKIDPAAYPELAPDTLLPAILTEMRHTLPDVYSVREMRLCPAERIKLKDGRPDSWSVRLEYNAKNATGGYTGIQRDVAVFRNGHVAYPIGYAPQLGRTGLDSLFARTVDKHMGQCPFIPDAAIQKALAADRQ